MSAAYLNKITLTFLGTLVGISGSAEHIKRLSNRGENAWERYGAPVLLCIRGSMEHYMQVDYLLGSDGADLMKYREAYLTECNMVAVAVRLIPRLTNARLTIGRRPLPPRAASVGCSSTPSTPSRGLAGPLSSSPLLPASSPSTQPAANNA